MDGLVERLKKLAVREIWSDDKDFCVVDYSGTNVDDAYYGGQDAGETLLARSLLAMLGVEYDHKE